VRQTLQSLYEQHRQGLFTLALSVTRRVDQAEDAVHEAFGRLVRNGLKPDDDPVAYAYAAVRNAAIDQVRKRSRVPAACENIFETPERDRGPDQTMVDRERDGLIREALNQLPDEQKECVVMKLYGGLTFDQIAQSRGEPLSTVASRYRRALQRLRSSVETLV